MTRRTATEAVWSEWLFLRVPAACCFAAGFALTFPFALHAALRRYLKETS